MDVNLSNINLSNAYNARSLMTFGNKRLTEFWLKEFKIPQIEIQALTDIAWHNTQEMNLPGTTIKYGNQLTLLAFLDEDFNLYKEQYDWIIKTAPGTDFVDDRFDGTLIVFDNGFKNALVSFTFEKIQITSIGEINYNNFGDDQIVLTLNYVFDKFTPKFYKGQTGTIPK